MGAKFAEAKKPPNSLITRKTTHTEVNSNFSFNSYPYLLLVAVAL